MYVTVRVGSYSALLLVSRILTRVTSMRIIKPIQHALQEPVDLVTQ